MEAKLNKKIEKKTGILSTLINVLVPILLALIIAIIPILIQNENPFKVYFYMIFGNFTSFDNIATLFHTMAPLILTGMAIGISFKAGLFNMGVESGVIVSGFVTAVLGYYLKSWPKGVLVPFLFLVGAICGIIVLIIPAILKAYLNVNEMVVTLLLNYAYIDILKYFTTYVDGIRDKQAGYIKTFTIGQNASLTGFFGSSFTLFFFIAILIFFILLFLIKRTKLGYRIDALGKNTCYSEAVGLNVKKSIIGIMLLSGAIAGIAGAGWLMSDKKSYALDFSGSPGLGWDGMVISLLGAHSPIGILVSSLFYGILKAGVNYVSFNTIVPGQIILIIQGLLILFLSFKIFTNKSSIEYIRLKNFINRCELYFEKKKNKRQKIEVDKE